MITLYHRPMTRSVRIHWLLEEMQLGYKLVTLTEPTDPGLEYRALQPFGKVPALTDGDVTLWESTAIVDYLLATYDTGQLAPAPGTPAAATHMSWRHFAEATLISTVADYAINVFWRPEEMRVAQVAAYAKETLQPLLDVVNLQLRGQSFILGDRFSAADVMVGHAAISCHTLDLIGPERAALQAYAEKMQARPCYKRITAQP